MTNDSTNYKLDEIIELLKRINMNLYMIRCKDGSKGRYAFKQNSQKVKGEGK